MKAILAQLASFYFLISPLTAMANHSGPLKLLGSHLGITILNQAIDNGTSIILHTGLNEWDILENGAIVLKSNHRYGLTVLNQNISNGAKIILHEGYNLWHVNSDGSIVLKDNRSFGITVLDQNIADNAQIILHNGFNRWTVEGTSQVPAAPPQVDRNSLFASGPIFLPTTPLGLTVLNQEIKDEAQIILHTGLNQWEMLENGAIVLKENHSYGLTVLNQNIADGAHIILHRGINYWRVNSDGSIVLKDNPEFGITVLNQSYREGNKLILHRGFNKWTTEPSGGLFPFINEASQQGSFFSTKDDPQSWLKAASKDWMKLVPGSTKVRRMSIPGTHDSGAKHGGLAVECQALTISSQLEAGIRYVDIRLRRTGKKFAIHHGAFYQKLMFGDVLDQIKVFLTAHPSECVIMRITENEYEAMSGSEDFSTIWRNYVADYPGLFYSTNNSDPALDDIRGRIYVMGQSNVNNGTGYKTQTDRQDYYKVYWFAHKETKDDDWATLPSKKEKVKDYLDKAIKASSGDNWVLNHLSGAVGMAPPDVARATNNIAYQHIKDKDKCSLGIVIMDFPGEWLIYRIIRTNFY